MNRKWSLLADVTWTGWSDFRELRIVRNGGDARGNPAKLEQYLSLFPRRKLPSQR
ncbi:MAG: hypothetical protein U5R30_03170 [Deltaproteobacteria bacterium]|nr:hypothetical protein [Deltaproteobacteria bacterium]